MFVIKKLMIEIILSSEIKKIQEKNLKNHFYKLTVGPFY